MVQATNGLIMTSDPKTKIEQMAPWFGEEEKRAVAEYTASGGWLTEYRKTAEFEQIIADYVGSRSVVRLPLRRQSTGNLWNCWRVFFRSAEDHFDRAGRSGRDGRLRNRRPHSPF